MKKPRESYRKTPQPCVVCSRPVGHEEGDAVGRHPSGRKRLLCATRACRKAWARDAEAIMAKWVENREAREASSAEGAAPRPGRGS